MSAPRARKVLRRAVVSTVVEIWRRLANRTTLQLRMRSSQVEQLEGRVLLSRVEGIDVSQFQGNVDWSLVRAAGKEFAFQRATIGGSADANNFDTKLGANMLAGASAGMLMGVYHHAKPDSSTNDAANEATWFLSNAEQYVGPGWLRPVIDVETNGGLSVSALSQWVNDFSDAVETATGVKPIIYSNTSNATNSLGTAVNDHELWVARYNTGTVNPQTDQPQTPSGFNNPYGVWNVPVGSTTPSHSSWRFWQYSNTGSVNGISGNVDLDVFQGDRAALESGFLTPGTSDFKGLGINFGPYEHAVPSGYINFGNQTFGDLFGYQMGWNATGVLTNTQATGPDARYKSYALPRVNGTDYTFELAVPNGDYRVRLVAGGVVGNTQKLWAEGVAVVDAVTNTGNEFRSGTAIVDVSDGRLTINSSSAGANTRLVFLDVVPAGRLGAVPAAPSGVTATAASSTAIDVRWTDNADNEGRDPSTFDSSTWAQVNEGYKIERRTYSGGSWSGWSPIAHARVNAEAFQDTGLSSSNQYQYRVSAVNAAGSSAAAEGVALTPASSSGQQAYTSDGTPWPLGVTIQAEDFDRGGEGVSFHDLSTDGNAGGFYRDAGMDVGRIGSTSLAGAPLSPRQPRIGWFRPGEWVEYTVNVPTAGAYLMQFRVSVPGSGAKFHATTAPVGGGTEVNLAGSDPNDRWDVPNTGNWNVFTVVDKTVTLAAGSQVIRVYADTKVTTNPGVMDFDWMRVVGSIPSSLTATAESATSIGLTWSSPGNAIYNVYRGTTSGFTPGSSNQIARGVAATSYTDRFLAPGTTYYYKVTGQVATSTDTIASNQASAQTAASATMDLVVSGMTDAIEESVGAYVQLNPDHDEENRDQFDRPANDNEPHFDSGTGQFVDRVNLNDDELESATLTLATLNTSGTWSLNFPGQIKVWRVSGSTAERITPGQTYPVTIGSSPTVIDLRIEGVRLSNSVRDTTLRATFTPSSGGAIDDRAKMTVSSVDVDVDGNNDEGFGVPDPLNKVEGGIEQDSAGIGKYVGVNDDDSDNDSIADLDDRSAVGERMTPLLVVLNKPFDLTAATFRFAYSDDDPLATGLDGTLRLWTDSEETRSGDSVAAGGDYLPAGDFTSTQVGFNPVTRKALLRIEGVQPTAGLPDADRTIELYVDPDGPGGPAPFKLFDDTRVTVVNRTPTGLSASAGTITVTLDWADGAIDLTRGYRVYRSTTPNFTPSSANLATPTPVLASTFVDAPPAAGTYYYRVTAVDPAGTNSQPSSEVNATVGGGGGPGLPIVTIVAEDKNAAEAGQDVARFRVTRTGSPVGDLVVSLAQTAGTATAPPATDADYTMLTTVTIPDGFQFATFDLEPTQDQTDEADETVTISVVAPPGSGYAVGAPAGDSATIADDDGGSTQPSADIDLFEDFEGDGIHDNSQSAELNEESTPLDLPLVSDTDPVRLALVLQGIATGETVTFRFDPAELRLYFDAAQTQPIAANTAINISAFGLTGSGTASMFAAGVAEGPLDGGLSVGLGSVPGSAFGAFLGGMVAAQGGGGGTPNDQQWYDNIDDNEGGLDDGDGSANQPLTNRDDFWTRDNGKNLDGPYLIIGVAGHTQGEGDKGHEGRMWNVSPNTGTYKLGEAIAALNFPVTIFPEDPGNNDAINPNPQEGRERCGDGVLGSPNFHHNGSRVSAPKQPGGALPTTGALEFLIDAIMNKGKTMIGLFGYSHGGGSLQVLIQALARRVNQGDNALGQRVVESPGGDAPVTFFWSAYIDAVDVDYDPNAHDAIGNVDPENGFPLGTQSDLEGDPRFIGTHRHYNIYQGFERAQAGEFEPNGTDLALEGEDDWRNNWKTFQAQWRRDQDLVPQVNTDRQGPDVILPPPDEQNYDWGPQGLDHFTDVEKGLKGIAEDQIVRLLVIYSLKEAQP